MDELVALVGRGAGEAADLLKRARIRQQVDAFAHGELAAPPLFGNAGLAAHLRGKRLASFEFVYFALPDHCCRLLACFAWDYRALNGRIALASSEYWLSSTTSALPSTPADSLRRSRFST